MKRIMLPAVACGALLAGALAVAPLAQAAQIGGSTGATSGPASGNSATNGNTAGSNAVTGNTGGTLAGARGTTGKPGSEAGPVPQKAPAMGASGSGGTTPKQ